MMQFILQLIEEHGLAVVFLNVLVEQAGAPVPAYPILVITGALLDSSDYSAFPCRLTRPPPLRHEDAGKHDQP